MLARRHLRIDRRAPLRSIFGTTTTHHIEVDLLDRASNRANRAIANWAMIHTDDGSNLCTGATQENLVGSIQFRAVYLPFASNIAKLAPRQFHHRITRNAQQNVFTWGWRDQFSIYHQENVLRASFRHMALACEHDRLIEAVLYGFALGER